jgi:hypothetical protein
MDIEEQKLLLVNMENSSKMIFDNFVIINRRFETVSAALDRIESFLKRFELCMRVFESELLSFGRKDVLQPTEHDPTKKSLDDKITC